MFLSHPSVKDEPDLEGRTAFMWAAGKGSDDVIRTMLALTPHIDINMADKYGGTGEHLRNKRTNRLYTHIHKHFYPCSLSFFQCVLLYFFRLEMTSQGISPQDAKRLRD